MQLRHISPGSSDWIDAMDDGEGGRGWEKLAPEELSKLRVSAESSGWSQSNGDNRDDEDGDDYGWRAASDGGSASR